MFKVGQEVVCIDASNIDELIEDKIYTIVSLSNSPCCNSVTLELQGLSESLIGLSYCIPCRNLYKTNVRRFKATRFKPLEEKKEKYSLLSNKEIIETITQEVPDKIKEKELC